MERGNFQYNLSNGSRMASTVTYRRASSVLALLLAATPLVSRYLNTPVPLTLPEPERCSSRFADAESRLASGWLLPLAEVDMYSLELINGISDTLAEKILRGRASIINIADYLRSGEKHRAFEVIHGIGIKTARSLSKYLDPLPSGKKSQNENQPRVLRENEVSAPCISDPA